ncbi:MAG: indolepyruvate oxidoreductase subunit beta [Alphaproteobacteria bacterium]|nr:indolepyruvate oxidoreductase subunit beta [Alphaproteobacteria bacterium]
MSDGRTNCTNVMVVGIGGQGVMTAAEALAQAALAAGHDAKKTEVAGMAQRGGVVASHVRFGRRVLSPAIPAGETDLLLAFEPAEGLRWCGQLRPGGLAIVNTRPVVPPVVSAGIHAYPEDPIAQIRAVVARLHAIDAVAIAEGLGNGRLANSVMLGAFAPHLPFDPGVLAAAMAERFRHRRPDLADLNAAAFQAGREAVAELGADAA